MVFWKELLKVVLKGEIKVDLMAGRMAAEKVKLTAFLKVVQLVAYLEYPMVASSGKMPVELKDN